MGKFWNLLKEANETAKAYEEGEAVKPKYRTVQQALDDLKSQLPNLQGEAAEQTKRKINYLEQGISSGGINPTAKYSDDMLKDWDLGQKDVIPNISTASASTVSPLVQTTEQPTSQEVQQPQTTEQASNTINPTNTRGNLGLSIWDAYRNGQITAADRDYLILDAIANYARNTGKDIGNVAAQFSGGTVDNNYDQSMWEKRNEGVMANETQAQAEALGGPAGRLAQKEQYDLALKGIDVARAERRDYLASEFQRMAKTTNSQTLKNMYMLLATAVGEGEIDGKVVAAAATQGGISDLVKLARSSNNKKLREAAEKAADEIGL